MCAASSSVRVIFMMSGWKASKQAEGFSCKMCPLYVPNARSTTTGYIGSPLPTYYAGLDMLWRCGRKGYLGNWWPLGFGILIWKDVRCLLMVGESTRLCWRKESARTHDLKWLHKETSGGEWLRKSDIIFLFIIALWIPQHLVLRAYLLYAKGRFV